MAWNAPTESGVCLTNKVQLQTFLVLNITGVFVFLYYINYLNVSLRPQQVLSGEQQNKTLSAHEKEKPNWVTHIAEENQQQQTISAKKKGNPIFVKNSTEKKQSQKTISAQEKRKPTNLVTNITEKKKPQTPQTITSQVKDKPTNTTERKDKKTISAKEKGKPSKAIEKGKAKPKSNKPVVTEKRRTPRLSAYERAREQRIFTNIMARREENLTNTTGQPFWQPVDPELRAIVYSAHYDDVSYPPIVRVVGAFHHLVDAVNASCLFYGPGGKDTRLAAGTMDRFRGRNGRLYQGAYAICPIPGDYHHFPEAVSVSISIDDDASSHNDWKNKLHVHYSHSESWMSGHQYPEPLLPHVNDSRTRINKLRSEDPQWRWNLTRCFAAITNKFNDYQRMAEMVAGSLAVGVDHFVFYLRNAGPQVKAMLQVLVDRGMAEVHPWNLDISDSTFFYSGQFSSHADCMYRHLWSSRYLLFGDMDELVIPNFSTSLFPLIEDGFGKDKSCGCLIIMHTFFNNYYPTERPPPEVVGNVSGLSGLTNNLTMMTHTLREKRVFGRASRSKYILDPHKILTPSVHIIQEARQGFKMCDTNKTEVLLHHYRFMDPVSNDTVRDASMWTFAKQIISTYDSLMTSFKHKTA